MKLVTNDLEFKGTKGNWIVPHFSRKDVECDCKYILAPDTDNSVATIDIKESETGNGPTKEEAYWNGRLLGNAKNLLKLTDKLRFSLSDTIDYLGDMDDDELATCNLDFGELKKLEQEAISLINEICNG